MTRETKSQKNQFQLNGGLNTEINELNFPDGYTRDETNYELLQDGSRRRRKGLAAETGASAAHTVVTHRAAGYNQCYVWKNVGGDPTKKVVVYRKGSELYFCDISTTLSAGWHTAESFDTIAFETSGATAALVDDAPLSFSSGRGMLLVTGQYVTPFRVEWDGSAYSAAATYVLIRDFTDIDDGIDMAAEPPASTADHRYNLRNRGFKQADIDSFLSAKSKMPAKNAIWYKGYKRALTASTDYDFDGVMSWDNDKMDGEAFGASSAPRGSIFLNPHDTTYGQLTSTAAAPNAVTTWSKTGTGTWEVTLTTETNHGLTSGAGDTFTLSGNLFTYTLTYPGGDATVISSLNGTYAVKAGSGTDQLIFDFTAPTYFTAFVDQYTAMGALDGGDPLTKSDGTAHPDSFAATEFFAGRAWYAGMANTEFADHVFFSQIVLNAPMLGKCFQDADPTDPDFNAIVAKDGGHIVIPGLAGVKEAKVLGNSLLIFSDQGVYEVAGSGRNVFTAEQHNVRKITDAGCSSPTGIVIVDNSAIYTGPGGIHAIGPNQYTGVLEESNLIQDTILTRWNQIAEAEQEKVQAFYDAAQRRVYFLYGANASASDMDTMLIMNMRGEQPGWSSYSFSASGLLTGVALPSGDSGDDNQRMKFLYKPSATTVQWADFNQTSFDDWDGSNGPLPYLLTGHDSIGGSPATALSAARADYQGRGQAPIITVFSKRTETGYTAGGNGWTGDNTSSTLMSARWDWSDDSVSNKLGATQEVYRHVRNFVPSGASDVDGYPVVVTRNKVRGRGRVLQLKFEGATDKDSHILGFTVNSATTRKK